MKPLHVDEGDGLDAAIGEQLERVRAAAQVQESSARLAGVTAQAAILQAYVSADAVRRIDRSLRDVNDATTEAAKAISEVRQSVSTIKEAADSFAASTAESEQSMRFWTKVQGGTAIALALFALAQVVVAVLEYLKPRP